MEKNTVFIAGKTAAETITDSTRYLVVDQTTGALLVSGTVTSSPDKETSYTVFKCNTAFTGASIGDIIVGILTINTVTGTLVSTTPIWFNFTTQAELVVLDTTKLTAVASNSLTAAELATMTLAISAVSLPLPTGAATEAKQDILLAELQLKANLTEIQPVSTQSKARHGSVTITRPATTPTYAAGVVIGDTNGSAIFELINFGTAGEQIYITDINLEIDVASVPSGMGTFTVHFYNASPTAIADNTAWDLVSADRSKYLGFQQLYTPSDKVSTLYSQNPQLSKSIILTGTSLFFILVTDASYAATSGAVKKLSFSGFAV